MRLGAVNVGVTGDGDTPSHQLLDGVSELIDDALQKTRSLTSEISPPVLYELGLEPAMRWLADRFRQRHGLRVDVKVEGPAMPTIGEESRIVLFHAMRELLLNVVKHAEVEQCSVRLRRERDSIEVRVEDRGRGFAADKLDRISSGDDRFGLFNIAQRMKRIGGRAEIRAQPGAGTIVTLVSGQLDNQST
jgi:signal transduction histidine kinase